MSLLDFLFPKSCLNCRRAGSYVCSDCFSFISFTDQSVCAQCHRPALAGLTHPSCQTRYSIDGIFASVSYSPVVKKLVHAFKYKPFLRDVHPLLTDLFYEGMIQKEVVTPLFSNNSVLVPIPLHRNRLRWRGYNQSALLAHGIGKRLSIPVVDALVRMRETQRQVGLSQNRRTENMKGAFAISRKQDTLQTTMQIFLVDDVVTSGATLREAASVFKRAGIAKVWGITLAHGE